jgi:hypothetical protein
MEMQKIHRSYAREGKTPAILFTTPRLLCSGYFSWQRKTTASANTRFLPIKFCAVQTIFRFISHMLVSSVFLLMQ